jgi:curved DNA-binding protein
MAVGSRDHYETLGVSRDASQDEIRAAHARLARKYHPDVNKEPGAEDRFKEISEAYDVLRDPEKRERYDRFGANWRAAGPDASGASGFEGSRGRGGGGFEDVRVDFGGGDFGGGDFGDIFEGLFGGRARRGGGGFGGGFSSRGGDREATLELSLQEAARGGRRRISLGDGHEFEVEIPPGVRDGQRIRLSGEGEPGLGGGPAGDLLLRVRVRPDKRFRVDGRDVYTDLPVTPWEAALGATVEVETLDGTAKVKVPPGSSSGRKLRLRGQGLGGGDLYAVVQIHVPKRLSSRERELFEQLAEVSDFNPRRSRRRSTA